MELRRFFEPAVQSRAAAGHTHACGELLGGTVSSMFRRPSDDSCVVAEGVSPVQAWWVVPGVVIASSWCPMRSFLSLVHISHTAQIPGGQAEREDRLLLLFEGCNG